MVNVGAVYKISGKVDIHYVVR